ncbi:conserved hypothetical integral membrane protein [Dethiosulfatibacter aminovorans DSM 17477]|uniref:Conserved hypothetical integral membrane protein n=1 Tax=Dethiosulfatibacter aminovorans DSM 17477 TaxID=1121476 RepID=A0A1M6GT19_9FIRM|nr:putative sulfate exporter family transporter [Dethiosulfatibacter aminovorans]SHJ13113.1 conserved hypothetical integral membrane protein [Dethiosulfatibacter aminovorans DSM 17477]
MKDIYKGLLLTAIISVISIMLNASFLNFIETMTIGILLGIIVANVFRIPESFDKGISFALKKILKWGIVLLGVKLNFSLLLELGPKILLLVVSLITIAITASYFVGRAHKLNPCLSVLLGVGSSICGASAIVAIAPVIGAEDEDVAISVTVISLLGAIGVIVYSFLAQKLPLTDLQYGIWSGSSLQGVAHAIAAAGARGTDNISLEIGTLVKMSRVALLAPVALVLRSLFSKSQERKTKFPAYVIYFILVGILFSVNDYFNFFPTACRLGDMTVDITVLLKKVSNIFILMSMVAMGLKVNFKSFESRASKALVICSFVFVLISLTSLAGIRLSGC